MSGRSGLFWDAVEGRAPLPPAAATLGLELIASPLLPPHFPPVSYFSHLYDTVGRRFCHLEPRQFIPP